MIKEVSGNREMALKFLQICRDSTNPKVRKALYSVSIKDANRLVRLLMNQLKGMPEVYRQAFATESILIYVDWATQAAHSGLTTQADTLDYKLNRQEVETRLLKTLFALSKQKPVSPPASKRRKKN